jgi:hypothetical protein
VIRKIAIIIGGAGAFVGFVAVIVLGLLTPITPQPGQTWFGEAIRNALPGLVLIIVSIGIIVVALVFMKGRSD